MKKYFFVLSMFIIPLFTNAADFTTVLNLGTGDNLGVAVEAYGSYYPCSFKIDGSDAIFTIYSSSDLSIKEKFTLQNILEMNDHSTTYNWYVRGLQESDCFRTCDAGSYVYLTKNVFNDDDNWEILLRLYSDETGYNNKVMNNKGEVVTTFLYSDTGLWNYNEEIKYMFFPDNSYLLVRGLDSDKIISFKGNGAGVKHVTALSGLNIYPNPLRRGESLTVRLQEQAGENAMLVITDMEGRTVYRQKIEAGATSATVEAGMLFPGKYIYTLISPDKQPLSGKLIVE